MIATIVLTTLGPAIPLPSAALRELRLHTGQRVRVEVQGLPLPPARADSDGRGDGAAWALATPVLTPVLEPDGTPA